MPRNPSLPILKCEFCPLATRNQFIFKRHRKRCLRENSSPSQKSALQSSAAEEGPPEGQEMLGSAVAERNESYYSVSDEGGSFSQGPSNDREDGDSPQRKSAHDEKNTSKEEEMTSASVPSKVSHENRITLRLRKRSVSELDTSVEQAAKRSCTESKMESDSEQEAEAEFKELEDSLRCPNSSGGLPPPNVCRNYKCGQCSFFTNKSREFLRHKIQQHKARLDIYSCTVCEYASQYKHKLMRHLSNSHNLHLKSAEVIPENVHLTAGGSEALPKKLLTHPQKLDGAKKVVSSKVAPRTGQTLDNLLVKLRTRQKVTEDNLTSFYTNAGTQNEEGAIGEGDLYKCKLCLFTATSKSKVIRHLHACHINARVFRCNLCAYKTYSKIEFYAHKKKHTSKNTTMFKCTECAYATEFRPNFDRHMVQHGSDKPNKCSLCSYATDHEGALKRHVTSHHPNTEENQSLVIAGDEGTGVKSSLGGEDEGEDTKDLEPEEGLEGDGYRCPLCSSLYRRLADLNRHMKSKHNVSRKEFFEHAGDDDEEVFDIDDDGDNEDDGDEEDFESDEDMEVEEPADSDDSDESQPLSKLCGKKSAGKKAKCSYCSYIPKWPGDLRRHMRVHSVVKRFKCSLCWKKYKYLGDLSVHMRRDHEVDPEEQHLTPEKVSIVATRKSSPKLFRCPACPFFTKVKVEMDRHSQEHTEEKTYSCKLCQYQTYWRGDMGRHLYRKHPSEVSNEADVKKFFIFRPDRRALSKGGRGVEVEADGENNFPDAESKASEGGEEPQPAVEEKEKTEEPVAEKKEGSAHNVGYVSESIANCTETTDQAGNKIYRCQLCSFSNHQAYKMKNHMDTHLNLKQFKCPVCGRRSNWKYDMRKHIASKHPSCKQDVVVLSTEEAKATIQDYISSTSNIKRDHHLNVGPLAPINTKSARLDSPQKTSTPQIKEKAELPQEKPSLPDNKKKRAYEYKCSHCQFRSWYRSSVTKHQHDEHPGLLGLGILAKPILISSEVELDDMMTSTENQDQEAAQEEWDLPEMKEDSVEKMDVDEEESVANSPMLYRCAECGKEGTSKGSIKKHYNYIHPDNEVRIISVADGVEFNYYTGLPTLDSVTPSSPVSDSKDRASLTSILNDPKKHGYSKPFKCSVCGQRSNWKWDIKKHLRAKHPGQFGHVIVLQLDQARATCPKKSSLHSLDEADDSGDSEINCSSVSEKEFIIPESKPAASPSNAYKYQEMLLGRYKRYKCSGCGYRSNWRTDICRHIERRHRDSNAEVIFMGIEEARETFESYTYQPSNVPSGSSSSDGAAFKSPKPPMPPKLPKKQQQALTTGRVWHCPKCKFMTAVRTHVVTHMQSHGMKPFRCIECGMMSRFRSPMNRHIRKQHSSTDYKAYCKLIIKYTKPAACSVSADRAAGQGRFVDAYLCRLCTGNTVETSNREEMMKHILSEHGSTDASQALKIKKKIGIENGYDADGNMVDEGQKGGKPKRYFCTICPYRTDKRGMLTFHHSYHQPSSQNKYRCKLCPYYVCAPRLLHQHMKCHEENMDDLATLESFGWKSPLEKTPPSSPSKGGKVSFESSPKRHACEKCPYTTNSKNDFLYHKQFHRPKPAAEYKCEYCDYWVTHRRLLRQHVRLHGEEYQDDSVVSSPSKSLASDASAVLDAVEIAAIKQKMIANKITASLSTFPAVSPMKIATQCSVGNRPGYILRDGVYKKLHQCSKCPYTNIRSRNVRLHELMHGWRRSDHPLMKCPHCDYFVGAKGLLSHHMKVHNQQYRPDPLDSTTFDLERREHAPGMASISAEVDDDGSNSVFLSPDIPQRQKVDTLLEISRFKKYGCEKCPYASGKRSHFMRHMELHGSRQRHLCQYCDYSVPTMNLLQQHQRIHLMPNQNLLATQSFSNLQHLKEVPADVALASALPPTDSSESVTINVIHDHLELYENNDTNSFDAEPKKLYRCDRCPYANVRRDHLLTHLRFHLTKSNFHCPYCDYSAPKQQLLTQHIRVHFCPLPELSEWLMENGQSERAQEVNDIDLTQALEVAEKFQTSPKRKLNVLLMTQRKDGKEEDEGSGKAVKKAKPDPGEKTGANKSADKEVTAVPDNSSASVDGQGTATEPQPSTSTAADPADSKAGEGKVGDEGNVYICQYCDREFPTSKLLITHELHHLIGNHFEFTDDVSPDALAVAAGKEQTTTTAEAEKDHQHVAPTTATKTTTVVVGRREEETIIVDSESDEESKVTSRPETSQTACGENRELPKTADRELNGKTGGKAEDGEVEKGEGKQDRGGEGGEGEGEESGDSASDRKVVVF
ncbi:uncharacterized protein LOC143285473 isoform X2 [Babylonia areolata]|uniref:uncharacterized protein LOC143285473 isoform X2 n=1 Tax=Babylonia areolata TaxID=304850 RepID=UPI003FD07455